MRNRHLFSSLLALFGLLFPLLGTRLVGKRVTIVITNLVPLVGLWVFDWLLVELFFYFILEIAVILTFHTLSVAVGPFYYFKEKLKDKVGWERRILVPLSWIGALFLAQIPFWAGLQFMWGIVILHEYLVREVARQTGSTEALERLLDNLGAFQLGETFWQSPIFYVLFLVGIGIFFFRKQDHAKNYVIAMGAPTWENLATYGITALLIFVDRLPLILLFVVGAFVTLQLISIFPALVVVVVAMKISIELYLNWDKQSVDPRMRRFAYYLQETKERLTYGAFFGFKRKRQWDAEEATKNPAGN